jgi:photosystem II stability/assembly factor-like uncharacterized protein
MPDASFRSKRVLEHTCIMRRAFLAVLLCSAVSGAIAQTYDNSLFGGLQYRLAGPFRGGRALAVTGVPGHPERFYFGAVGGGVWESENAGRTWKPIFDSQSVASIGAMAVAPSNPDIIYVGSGEADMRGDIQQGDGMYKSTDAGKTWSHIGLVDTRQIGKVLIDPKDPNIVYVAALGHQYGPNEERGVFKTTDGGASWHKVLYKNPNVGAIDLDMDPTDSNVVYAALWSTRRPPWSVYPPSNGPDGGLFKSTDAGQTWTQLQGAGFPTFTGRIGIAVSPANHNRLYTLVDTNEQKTGGVYRSDDAGATWTFTDGEPRVWGRGWYFAGITADPKNADEVYVMNTSAYRSTDGGKSFTPYKGAPGGDDYHTLWIAPDDANRMIVGSDQGVVVSVDCGTTWSSWYNQPTGQFYHVSADNRMPYWIYGAQQDSGAMALPSRTIHSGISAMDTRPIDAGGESDMVTPDPFHPGVVFGSNGVAEELSTASNRSIEPTVSHYDEVWRAEWTRPIAISEADPHLLYFANQKIFLSSNGGTSWKVMSPDLTRETTPAPENLDQSTATDDTGLTRKGVVYWIAPSPIKAPEVWAGTDDGQIWVTQNQGDNWKNVTPPELTAWSKVGVIDASHFNGDTAYAAIDRHRLDDNKPYIYRTRDLGQHWTLITNGIPEGQFVNVVREDPKRAGLLYAGTDWGVFVSFDDGDHWQSLQLNLPAASIRDIIFQGDDIIVGTHGRAIWILDNPAPLRQLTPSIAASGAALFKPGKALLFHRSGSGDGPMDEGTPLPPEEPQGQNPAWGAIFDYCLPEGGTVSFRVYDSKKRVLRTISSRDPAPKPDLKRMDIPAYWVHPHQPPSGEAGAHRYAWNLRYQNDGGPLLPPGTYTVEMNTNITGYGLKTFSQTFEVVRDPRIDASDSDLRKQFEFALQIDEEVKAVQTQVAEGQSWLRANSSKLTQEQTHQLRQLLGGGGGGGRRGRPAGTPDMGATTSQDVSSLSYLAGAIGGVSRAVQNAPGAPSQEQARVFDELKRKVADIRAELEKMGVKFVPASPATPANGSGE